MLNDRARKNQGAPEKQDPGCDPGERRGILLPDSPGRQDNAATNKDDRGGVPQAQNQFGPGSAPVGRRMLDVWHSSQLPDVPGRNALGRGRAVVTHGGNCDCDLSPACKS